MFLSKIIVKLFFILSFIFLSRSVYAQNDKVLTLPNRDSLFCTGSDFVKKIDTVAFETREEMIVKEILQGNIPCFLRKFMKFSYVVAKDTVEFYALPDYLAIGSSSDFLRIPMGPLAAQQIADTLFCSLPTAFLVDKIAQASQGAIEPFPFRPLGDRNTRPIVFEDSNNAINALYQAKGYLPGQLISGLKKDVILTCKITDSARLNHVTIYGWHYPNGKRIQPSNNVHINTYVDYSHGIRLIYRMVKINGIEYDIQYILSNPNLYMLVSDEPAPMKKATYAGDMLHP